ASALTSATSARAAEPARREVRIGYLPIAASLPLYVALERRLFQAEGLEPHAKPYASSDALGHAGAAHEVDVLSSLALNVAFETARRTDERPRIFCANAYSDSPGQTVDYLLARKGAGVAKVEDLAGKRVGAFPGSVTKVFVLDLLAKHGIP